MCQTHRIVLDTISVCVLVSQSCLTLCDPMDCSPSGSSVHGILQAITLEWVAIPFSRGSSRPRDRTLVSTLQATSLPKCFINNCCQYHDYYVVNTCKSNYLMSWWGPGFQRYHPLLTSPLYNSIHMPFKNVHSASWSLLLFSRKKHQHNVNEIQYYWVCLFKTTPLLSINILMNRIYCCL